MSKIREDVKPPDSSPFEEAKLLLSIAFPTCLVQLFIFIVFTFCASFVGRILGTHYLASFSLGSLCGNLTCLSVMIGSLTASDTLSPRAYGMKDYPEVGRLAIRGFLVSIAFITPPVIVIFFFLEPILLAFGQDPSVSHIASGWVRIYLLGIPFILLFRVLQRFLNAQHIVMPLVYSGAVGCFIVCPIALKLLVKEGDDGWGIWGSAYAVVLSQIATTVFLLGYLVWKRPFEEEAWDGCFMLREAVEIGPTIQFIKLSAGGIMSFTEWWFWETVCFMVGSLGVTPLCVHTIAYQMVPMVYMIVLGISIALSVRMGNLITMDVAKVKKLALNTWIFCMILGAFTALAIFQARFYIFAFFTTDEFVKEECEKIWPYVCCHIFFVYIYCITCGILRALGLQWAMARIITTILWCITLPLMYYFSIVKQGGLAVIWICMPCAYCVLDISLCFHCITTDWDKIAKEIQRRDYVVAGADNEFSPLLNVDTPSLFVAEV